MFYLIGKIGHYTKQYNLNKAMKFRIRTGGNLKQATGQNVTSSMLSTNQLKKTKKTGSAYKTAIIKQKLRTGAKLSGEELKYLKENNPDLYEKAKKADKYRTELQEALKHVTTKDEAKKAVMRLQMKMLAELKAGGGTIAAASGIGTDGADASVASTGLSASPMAGTIDVDTADLNTDTSFAGDVGANHGASLASTMNTPNNAGIYEPNIGTPNNITTQEQNIDIAEDNSQVKEPVKAAINLAGIISGIKEEINTRTELEASDKESTNSKYNASDTFLDRQGLSKAQLIDIAEKASDATSPVDETMLYILAALQREWLDYAGSRAYKELPENEREKHEHKKTLKPANISSNKTNRQSSPINDELSLLLRQSLVKNIPGRQVISAIKGYQEVVATTKPYATRLSMDFNLHT